jgi:hypothetical protein
MTEYTDCLKTQKEGVTFQPICKGERQFHSIHTVEVVMCALGAWRAHICTRTQMDAFFRREELGFFFHPREETLVFRLAEKAAVNRLMQMSVQRFTELPAAA